MAQSRLRRGSVAVREAGAGRRVPRKVVLVLIVGSTQPMSLAPVQP